MLEANSEIGLAARKILAREESPTIEALFDDWREQNASLETRPPNDNEEFYQRCVEIRSTEAAAVDLPTKSIRDLYRKVAMVYETRGESDDQTVEALRLEARAHGDLWDRGLTESFTGISSTSKAKAR